MTYNIYWADKKVRKTFDSMSPFVQSRVIESIRELSSNPRPSGVKRLVGKLQGVWRIRIGDFRLLYDIDDKAKKVVLLGLGHRRQIYR